MKIVQFAGYVVLSLAVGQAWGQPVFIDVGDDCSKTIVDSVGQACEGKGQNDVCRRHNETVNWVVRPGNNDFEVSFFSDSPFGDDTACLTQTGRPCRIPESTPIGDYDYDVAITGCEAMDPRILVR